MREKSIKQQKIPTTVPFPLISHPEKEE